MAKETQIKLTKTRYRLGCLGVTILVLRDLHVARAGLIKDRTRLRNRAQTQDIAVLKRQTKARLAQLERHVVELDAEIAALIAAGQTTARNRDILCSMPGISPAASRMT
jgi:transposase